MALSPLVAATSLRRGMMNNETVRLAQFALRRAGAELEPDADFGPMTENAVKQFQRVHHLVPTGVVDAPTALALDNVPVTAAVVEAKPLDSVLGVAPWLSVARSLTGTKEFAASADNPIILGWVSEIVADYPDLKGTVGWYDHDSVPWCGLFAAYCMTKGGFKPPKLALGAANWFNDWQDGYRLDSPCPGAVLVKTRTGGGHVTFYECEDSDYYYCRGGNQSDMVNVSAIRKDVAVRGFMWPKGAMASGKRKFGSIATARAGSEA